jgi:AAA15 family ATPase/GTPase
MLIKQLTLENCCRYKGIKTLEFNKGLNIITGSHGSGKTSIINAIEWVMNVSRQSKAELCNKSVVKQLRKGERDNVVAEIILADDTESYKIKRNCVFEKSDNGLKVLSEAIRTEELINDGFMPVENISKAPVIHSLFYDSIIRKERQKLSATEKAVKGLSTEKNLRRLLANNAEKQFDKWKKQYSLERLPDMYINAETLYIEYLKDSCLALTQRYTINLLICLVDIIIADKLLKRNSFVMIDDFFMCSGDRYCMAVISILEQMFKQALITLDIHENTDRNTIILDNE